jgi:hypothetical protein
MCLSLDLSITRERLAVNLPQGCCRDPRRAEESEGYACHETLTDRAGIEKKSSDEPTAVELSPTNQPRNASWVL